MLRSEINAMVMSIEKERSQTNGNSLEASLLDIARTALVEYSHRLVAEAVHTLDSPKKLSLENSAGS